MKPWKYFGDSMKRVKPGKYYSSSSHWFCDPPSYSDRDTKQREHATRSLRLPENTHIQCLHAGNSLRSVCIAPDFRHMTCIPADSETRAIAQLLPPMLLGLSNSTALPTNVSRPVESNNTALTTNVSRPVESNSTALPTNTSRPVESNSTALTTNTSRPDESSSTDNIFPSMLLGLTRAAAQTISSHQCFYV